MKRLFALLMTCCLGLFLMGCGGSSDADSSVPEPADPTAPAPDTSEPPAPDAATE